MKLIDIVKNSSYVAADESINQTSVTGYANSCIAEINRKIGSNLPFFVAGNYDTVNYDAFGDTWQMSLIEPYLAYMIMANDDNENQWRFHYNRFLDAVNDFKSKGTGTIAVTGDDGTPTGYEGTASRMVKVEKDNAIYFQRW